MGLGSLVKVWRVRCWIMCRCWVQISGLDLRSRSSAPREYAQVQDQSPKIKTSAPYLSC